MATLLARILVAAFFIFSCKAVIERDYNLQIFIKKIDLSIDPIMLSLNISNYDFGVRLDYTLKKKEPEVFKNLDSYVELMVSQNIDIWFFDDSDGLQEIKEERVYISMVPCSNGRLILNSETPDFLGI